MKTSLEKYDSMIRSQNNLRPLPILLLIMTNYPKYSLNLGDLTFPTSFIRLLTTQLLWK